ncbi:MAG: DUF2628 domain-containing protein [Clostridia bacterium]|nr:DUF2628 domain-containing protein [Clostridia bacterium]
MSLNSNGISCARCKSYLFSEDDVVYCHVCGAPHHRECYNALGHCALEELHGTENEYSRRAFEENQTEVEDKKSQAEESTVKCQMCGERYDITEQRCPNCGTPDLKSIGAFREFDFLGGVPADYDLGDGVTASDAKLFVGTNTHRYIPKFAVLNKKNKFSWNWLAFLCPAGWLLSRKMYGGGIATSILTVTAACLSYPLSLKLYGMGMLQNSSLPAKISEVADALPEIGVPIIGLALLGTVINVAVSLVLALLGDYIYKNHSLDTIKKIKSQSTDVITDYRKKGGVNFALFLLGYMIAQYGYLIIQYLF